MSTFQTFLQNCLKRPSVTPYHEAFDKVSNRLPARPRLVVEDKYTGRALYRLLPHFIESGRVAPNYWTLPAQRNPIGKWWSPIASTSQLAERMEPLGLRVRVLA